jgi:hypothetical protein
MVLVRNVFVHKLLVAVLHQWRWEYYASGGCVTLVVVAELSVVVSLEQRADLQQLRF